MIFADFRMTLTLAQIRQLAAAGYLPADPECPGELRAALTALLASLPMPLSPTPNHGLRAQ